MQSSLEELETFKNQIYNYIETIETVYEQYSEILKDSEVGIDLNTSDDEEDLTNGKDGILSSFFGSKKKNKAQKSLKKVNSLSKGI